MSRLIAVMECISGWSFISFLPGICNYLHMCVFVWVLAFKVPRMDLCIRQQRRDCAVFLSLIKSLFPSLLLNILGVFRINIQWLFLIFFLEDSMDFFLSGKHSSALFCKNAHFSWPWVSTFFYMYLLKPCPFDENVFQYSSLIFIVFFHKIKKNKVQIKC